MQNVDSFGFPTLSLIGVAPVELHLACPFAEIALREEIIRIMILICFSRKLVVHVIAVTLQ